MSDKPLIECRLCRGKGILTVPVSPAVVPEYNLDLSVLINMDLGTTEKECPKCFGHGVQEDNDEPAR